MQKLLWLIVDLMQIYSAYCTQSQYLINKMLSQSTYLLRSREDQGSELIILQKQNIECQICFKTYAYSQFFSFGCQHYFCKNCLISALSQEINQFFTLRCCQDGCQHIIDQSQHSIYHIIPNTTKKKVDLFLDNLDRIHNVRICKKCNIGALIQKINRQSKQILQCNQCFEISCYNCFGVSHEGKCTSLETLDYPPNCGQCRKCKSIIEKIVGCSHVKCICGYQFCFECSYHWDPSHICQFKLQKRTGYSKWICDFLKIVIAVPLSVFILLFYIAYILIICFVSSMIFGVLGWINVMERKLKISKITSSQIESGSNKQSNDNSCTNCLLFIGWIILLPIAMIFFAIVGFFVPFWNLCYQEKVVLSPTIIKDLWMPLQSWIDVYFLL